MISDNYFGSPALLLKGSVEPVRHLVGSADKPMEETGCSHVVCSKSAGEPE